MIYESYHLRIMRINPVIDVSFIFHCHVISRLENKAVNQMYASLEPIFYIDCHKIDLFNLFWTKYVNTGLSQYGNKIRTCPYIFVE